MYIICQPVQYLSVPQVKKKTLSFILFFEVFDIYDLFLLLYTPQARTHIYCIQL